MIPNGERLHYIALKKLSTVLGGKASKQHDGSYGLNCLHYFATENKHESYKKLCENKNFCNIIMPSDDTKILEINQSQKFDKVEFIIYADLECLTKKIDGCKNKPSLFLKNGLNIYSFINLTVTRTNALQVAPNHAKLRENVW